MEIERLKSARVGNVTSDEWWAGQQKLHTEDELEKIYQPLVDKLGR